VTVQFLPTLDNELDNPQFGLSAPGLSSIAQGDVRQVSAIAVATVTGIEIATALTKLAALKLKATTETTLAKVDLNGMRVTSCSTISPSGTCRN
jgi:hypothetical protein